MKQIITFICFCLFLVLLVGLTLMITVDKSQSPTYDNLDDSSKSAGLIVNEHVIPGAKVFIFCPFVYGGAAPKELHATLPVGTVLEALGFQGERLEDGRRRYQIEEKECYLDLVDHSFYESVVKGGKHTAEDLLLTPPGGNIYFIAVDGDELYSDEQHLESALLLIGVRAKIIIDDSSNTVTIRSVNASDDDSAY